MSLYSDAQTLAMIKKTGANTQGTYTNKAGGDPVTLFVDFRDEFELLQGEGEVQYEGKAIEANVRTSDLTGTAQGGTLVVGGTTYEIRDALADGEGMTTLYLREA